MRKEFFAEYFKDLQDSICKKIEETDGQGRFKEDAWKREGGGGGRSRVLKNGNILEKAGVNFSAVFGPLHPKMVSSLQLKEEVDFFASGVSIVMHPMNPWVPIIHMNVRYFELSNGESWFGGGIDLTPHIVIPEQAKWFHQQLKKVCDKHDKSYYPKFKTWADDYFFNTHREETRGIGGIFFDYVKSKNIEEKMKVFDFVKSVGESFADIYSHLMVENALKPFGKKEKDFQLLRRGRYVEFNLVHDRGTKFGLETNGRTESILMSLPPLASWEYMYDNKSYPEGKQTLDLLKKNIDWINY
ncbi:oxygen-dependent coproporphyrinogen oxidase [Sandaracinomonas limnophila]|uniref:coproporphyrinogen oxidase n=1 Tax=Sandaracinomonas limnophila TaxID=1862386 RepID=A0A437PXC3_9BACT|nr:oxygen-dependent coproporphyrinogen oxidase [Sandaracinomonas limnophila]RVU26907.1 oxygen-dependent coproporphyrinogen oxidase [Sandaracinomonas limnophila]